MSIVHYKFNRRFLLVLSQLLIIYQGYTQEIKGVYVLGINNETYYVNFKNDSYDLFSLQENPLPGGKTPFVLKEVGSGLFNKFNKNISLRFDSNIQRHHFYSTDSVVCSMHTQQPTAFRTFEITMKADVPEYENTYLIIEGYSKEYPFHVKDGKLKTELPDSLTIRNIYVSVMGYGRRQLPYDQHYNTFRYGYFLKDTYPHVRLIKNETWNLPVKSQNKNGYFKLNNTNYLTQADERIITYLRKLADENFGVKQVISGWFNK